MIKEETEILYAFKGAYTYQDLQNMSDYEVMLINEAFKDIKETERIAIERAKNANGNSEVIDAPIILKNSRFNLPEDNNEKEEASE